MRNSNYIKDPIFRKFERTNGSTYYLPVDQFLNAADNVLVDVHDPNSAGFGGSMFNIKTTEGVDEVKGPWHGTCPYEVCSVTELHFTSVTLVANAEHIPYQYATSGLVEEHGRDSIEVKLRVTGDILYEEKERVLGPFYRGDRIAQQLADLRQEDIYFHVESDGGSHSGSATPGRKLHPRAERQSRNRERDLSSEQSFVVEM